MSFPNSPGVYGREFDASVVSGTNIGTSAVIAGAFTWGPINQIVRISDENRLVARFGKPTDENGIDFFLAASYLAYANALDVVRVGLYDAVGGCRNAVHGSGSAIYVPNDAAYDPLAVNISSLVFFAKYAGSLGNSVAIATCTGIDQYSYEVPVEELEFTRSNVVVYTSPIDAVPATVVSDFASVGDFLVVDGTRYIITAIVGDNITLNKVYSGSLTPTRVLRKWKFATRFQEAPTSIGVNHRSHVVVFDYTGKITGEVGTILETYEDVDYEDSTAKKSDGSSAYFLNQYAGSSYIRAGGDVPDSVGLNAPSFYLSKGADGFAAIGYDDYMAGWSLFIPNETVKAPLIIGGAIDETMSPFIALNLADSRRDGVAFFSPKLASVLNNVGDETADIIADREVVSSSSYAALDDNWKYTYDRYNDKYRWIPCAGDHAGLYARVDVENNPWDSAAGTRKGLIKGAVKLAWNSREADRDELYPRNINSIVDFPSSGPTLYGDKTLLSVNSALSRVPTRRLMLLIEGVVIEASADLLFEFNDEFTRARFNSIVEPFLRGIQAKRGLAEYRVIADESVNTPQVIANNQFIGQIYIKPNYSINFIRIDFIVVGATVTIEEVVGIA